jgi:hypothetical protein
MYAILPFVLVYLLVVVAVRAHVLRSMQPPYLDPNQD